MTDELPKGWAVARVSELCEVPKEKGRESVVPYLEIGNVDIASKGYALTDKPSVKGCRIARRNDVLVSKVRPTRGAIIWIREDELQVSSAFTVLRNKGALAEKCLWQFLAWNRRYLNHLGENCTGTMYPTTSDEVVVDFEMPLAPLPEQRRILAKLETLLGKVDASQQRLANIPVLLKRFRQSVLAAACSGRLTADWREENSTGETAEVLLAKIKEKRLASARTQKEKDQIEEVFDERNLRIDEGDVGLDDIPGTWLSCRIGAIGAVCNGSTPSRKQPKFWGGAIPWVSSGEVRNNLISETWERITKAGYEGSSVRLLPRGSVLIAMIGEGKTRGQTAILNIEATINQNIAAVVLDHGLVSSQYLWRWFQLQYEATRERGGGSGPQALNCQRVRELPFVLPPLPEQQEIVRRVEGLFALADQLELRLAKARCQVDKLTPSLLARAFAGKLVPQDSKDEPASTLLERIRLRHNGNETKQRQSIQRSALQKRIKK
jgi:type I restriction enzyme S subunit